MTKIWSDLKVVRKHQQYLAIQSDCNKNSGGETHDKIKGTELKKLSKIQIFDFFTRQIWRIW